MLRVAKDQKDNGLKELREKHGILTQEPVDTDCVTSDSDADDMELHNSFAPLAQVSDTDSD